MSVRYSDAMPGVSKPLRLLVVCPSWLGDCVMATPACRALREELPGAFIGALVRPGMEERRRLWCEARILFRPH